MNKVELVRSLWRSGLLCVCLLGCQTTDSTPPATRSEAIPSASDDSPTSSLQASDAPETLRKKIEDLLTDIAEHSPPDGDPDRDWKEVTGRAFEATRGLTQAPPVEWFHANFDTTWQQSKAGRRWLSAREHTTKMLRIRRESHLISMLFLATSLGFTRVEVVANAEDTGALDRSRTRASLIRDLPLYTVRLRAHRSEKAIELWNWIHDGESFRYLGAISSPVAVDVQDEEGALKKGIETVGSFNPGFGYITGDIPAFDPASGYWLVFRDDQFLLCKGELSVDCVWKTWRNGSTLWEENGKMIVSADGSLRLIQYNTGQLNELVQLPLKRLARASRGSRVKERVDQARLVDDHHAIITIEEYEETDTPNHQKHRSFRGLIWNIQSDELTEIKFGELIEQENIYPFINPDIPESPGDVIAIGFGTRNNYEQVQIFSKETGARLDLPPPLSVETAAIEWRPHNQDIIALSRDTSTLYTYEVGSRLEDIKKIAIRPAIKGPPFPLDCYIQTFPRQDERIAVSCRTVSPPPESSLGKERVWLINLHKRETESTFIIEGLDSEGNDITESYGVLDISSDGTRFIEERGDDRICFRTVKEQRLIAEIVDFNWQTDIALADFDHYLNDDSGQCVYAVTHIKTGEVIKRHDLGAWCSSVSQKNGDPFLTTPRGPIALDIESLLNTPNIKPEPYPLNITFPGGQPLLTELAIVHSDLRVERHDIGASPSGSQSVLQIPENLKLARIWSPTSGPNSFVTLSNERGREGIYSVNLHDSQPRLSPLLAIPLELSEIYRLSTTPNKRHLLIEGRRTEQETERFFAWDDNEARLYPLDPGHRQPPSPDAARLTPVLMSEQAKVLLGLWLLDPEWTPERPIGQIISLEIPEGLPISEYRSNPSIFELQDIASRVYFISVRDHIYQLTERDDSRGVTLYDPSNNCYIVHLRDNRGQHIRRIDDDPVSGHLATLGDDGRVLIWPLDALLFD